jgi:hypothetical protein
VSTKTISLITCERCGHTGQTTGHWYTTDYGMGPQREFAIDQPDTWKGFIKYEKEVFAIGVKHIVKGHTQDWYPGEGDDDVDIRIDLCPTCRMSFLTWWLEGKKR